MQEAVLYGIWGALYILCVGLGKVEDPQGFGKVLLVFTALIFFLPGALLLYKSKRNGKQKHVKAVRIISIVSLSVTLITFIANLLSVNASAQTGQILYDLLILVSAPMICGQYWIMSLFLWACLLSASFMKNTATPNTKWENSRSMTYTSETKTFSFPTV